MASVETISALATAGGTLVLAGATFAAVRSANRSARITERALLAGLRPLLLTPQVGDPPQKVRFRDDHTTVLESSRGHAENDQGTIYLAFGVRNAGSGLAVLDRWRWVESSAAADPPLLDVDQYRRLTRDLYVPAGGVGFWQGACRDPNDPEYAPLRDAIDRRDLLVIDVLYGDYEGGQRTVSRFSMVALDDSVWFTQVVRHWHVDRPDPR